MNKKLALLVVMLLLFTLSGCGISSLFEPKIDSPVFVKSLIYSEEMDIDFYYIAPGGFDKSVEKIQIPNAPDGIDCVVYGEEKESDGRYTVGTVNTGVNCDFWSEETGIGNDLEINELLVTWTDGSQTTEDVGSITITAGNRQCEHYMNIAHDDDISKATYTVTKDTEITGLDFSGQDEVFHMISNITINDVPLEEISKDRPMKLKKNEICIVEYQIKDENKSPYGNVSIQSFLMGKTGKDEEKIASFTIDKKFGFDEGAGDYLKDQKI